MYLDHLFKGRVSGHVSGHSYYTVRPNKKDTEIVSYFSAKQEQFMVNDIYYLKVQLFFFHLTPFMKRKSHAYR